MNRYVGTKHSTIYTVSDCPFTSDVYTVLEIPTELNSVASNELMTNYCIRHGKIVAKNAKIAAKDLRIAIVGNYKMACGISTYNENLWPRVCAFVGDYKLFIERNESPTGSIYSFGDQVLSSDKVSSCWERGGSLQELVSEIKLYDPDIVWIAHEFGIWPVATYWLSMISQLSDYRIITTMHSIYHHKDKSICESAMKEIIVHLEGAKDILKNEKRLSADVYVIPHGCSPCIDKTRLWNFYKTNHTFIQQGFGFRYKSFERSIKACAILKKKYNDVFFTAIFAESPQNLHMHQVYYNELMELVEALGLQENVAIIRGFQSDVAIDNYLRTNKVAVFPYTQQVGFEVFGASGAARQAMTANIPVISSSIPHFSDIASIKADAPEDIARELDALFSNPNAVKEQLEKQEKFLIENSWENVARKHIEIFENR